MRILLLVFTIVKYIFFVNFPKGETVWDCQTDEGKLALPPTGGVLSGLRLFVKIYSKLRCVKVLQVLFGKFIRKTNHEHTDHAVQEARSFVYRFEKRNDFSFSYPFGRVRIYFYILEKKSTTLIMWG